MRKTYFIILLFIPVVCFTQVAKFEIDLRANWQGEKIELDNPIITSDHDTLAITKLKFYISNIRFDFFGEQVYLDPSSYLIDIAVPSSTNFKVAIPYNIAFSHVHFDLGVDSLTNAAGAQGGDLDPMHGMYWTWQSGYINFKLEGTASHCPGRKNEFIYHIGGYQAPYQSIQKISIEVFDNNWVPISMDIEKLYEFLDLKDKYYMMSPGAETVSLAEYVASIFKVDR